jgi:hypothetical protein
MLYCRMLLIGCFVSFAAQAQPPVESVPRVIREASSTLYAPATHADFRLEKTITSESLEAGMQDALALPDRLRALFQEWDLHPAETLFPAPEIDDIAGKTIRCTALIRFTLTGYAAPDNGVPRFAALCDRLIAAAEKLGAALSGPDLVMAGEEELMRRAIEAAVAEAYPAADAVANVLNSNIYAVEKVEILEIGWDYTPERRTPQTPMKQAACTARVRVTYSITPRS